MKRILFAIFLLAALAANASHNRGGEITYRHIQGYQFEITITTYTKTSSIQADRPVLDSVHLGDGTMMPFNRDAYWDMDGDIRVNVYVEVHTYPFAGTYDIYFIDPNRNNGVINIPNSFNTPFCVKSQLIISSCVNNSVVFPDMPIMFAQRSRTYVHNVAVRDNDHDSLSFELTTCLGENGDTIGGYYIPSGFSINPFSGQIRWMNPQDTVGEYNFAVKIKEYRNSQYVGYVIRDFQITLREDADTSYYFSSLPLSTDSSGDYYAVINPGDSVSFTLTYTDNLVAPMLHAYGEATYMTNPPTIIINGSNASFVWHTDTSHARLHPYIFTFRGVQGIRQRDLTVMIYVTGNRIYPCLPLIGIEEPEVMDDAVKVFPNPFSDALTVRWDDGRGMRGEEEVMLFDITGKEIMRRDFSGDEIVIDTKQLAAGFYLLRVGGRSYKIVKGN